MSYKIEKFHTCLIYFDVKFDPDCEKINGCMVILLGKRILAFFLIALKNQFNLMLKLKLKMSLAIETLVYFLDTLLCQSWKILQTRIWIIDYKIAIKMIIYVGYKISIKITWVRFLNSWTGLFNIRDPMHTLCTWA